jgi:hypothetical protein
MAEVHPERLLTGPKYAKKKQSHSGPETLPHFVEPKIFIVSARAKKILS